MPSGTIKEYQEKIEFYELVLDNIRNGVMITDPDGEIIFFSANRHQIAKSLGHWNICYVCCPYLVGSGNLHVPQ